MYMFIWIMTVHGHKLLHVLILASGWDASYTWMTIFKCLQNSTAGIFGKFLNWNERDKIWCFIWCEVCLFSFDNYYKKKMKKCTDSPHSTLLYFICPWRQQPFCNSSWINKFQIRLLAQIILLSNKWVSFEINEQRPRKGWLE